MGGLQRSSKQTRRHLLLLLGDGNIGRKHSLQCTDIILAHTDVEQIMDKIPLLDASGVRHYLLDKTQHIIGGFGKSVGEVPG